MSTGWVKCWLLVGLLCDGLSGCQSAAVDQTQVVFNQTPPAVRSAFLSVYHGATIQKILRQTQDGQDYYTFTYTDAAAQTHVVELNEGGDQVGQH